MKVAISIIWFVFALLFLALGRAHWIEAEQTPPPFELTERGYEVSGSGFQVKIDVRGTPLDQPFENFVKEFNAYLDGRNEVERAANQRAAWGYFLASAAALVSMLLSFRRVSSDADRRVVTR